MADDFEIEIKGLDELQAELENLGTNEARNICRAAARAGAVVFQEGMVASAASIHGEPGQMLREKKNWKISSRSTRGDDLAASAKIRPSGSLPEEHKSRGKGRQPKDRIYKRGLAYLVKLLEFGPSGGKYLAQRFPVMTSGFESNKDKALDKVIGVIKERLKL